MIHVIRDITVTTQTKIALKALIVMVQISIFSEILHFLWWLVKAEIYIEEKAIIYQARKIEF